MQNSIVREKNLQFMCDSPFIIKLHATYSNAQTLYLLLEVALGGELYTIYSGRGFHGSAHHAKFYVAGTVFAFEHLHERKIVFRDLKPENLILDERGHVKLTDLGLAKQIAGKTFSSCGTPDYFAPEIIQSKGHSFGVDWWTLGILTFELMVGHPPFQAATAMQTYTKVTRGIGKVNFPSGTKGHCESLVKGLCQQNSSDRLPMKTKGTERIKKHSWYAGFDWAAAKNRTMTPPFIPKVSGKTDLSNFPVRKGQLAPQLPYKAESSDGWDADFATDV